MNFEEATNKQKFNALVSHPLQAFEWGQFREKTGVKVIRRQSNREAFQLTIHNAPLGFKIGYFPKGGFPSKEIIEELKKIGRQENLIYIQLEPKILKSSIINHKSLDGLRPSFHPLFTKHTFILDLEKSEEELLASFHPKTRYNIKVAQKHNVAIKEDNSDEAFEEYLKLTKETTERQGFYAHTEKYHRLMWETLKPQNTKNQTPNLNELSAHLFTATYKGKTLTTWVVFIFKDTIYYPYGASSSENRETMSSTLLSWEVIKYAKSLGLKNFDMWGSLGENPNPKDPWFGFHRFKSGFSPELVEYAGSFDFVVNPLTYQGAKLGDKARWMILRAKAR